MKKQIAYLQKLFYDLWNDYGAVYLVVNHSDRTRIGKRGVTEAEKTRGLILVFNNKTSADLVWDAEGNLSCVLAFGSRREDVYIHHDDLRAVFSPDAKVQFLRSDMEDTAAASPEPQQAAPQEEEEEKQAGKKQVVSIDSFRKRKKDMGKK